MLPGIAGIIPVTPSITEFEYLSSVSQDRATASSSTFTFNSFNIGAENQNRVIVLGVMTFLAGAASNALPTVTVNSVTATCIAGDPTSFASIEIFIFAASVPTGNSVTITVNPNRTMNSCGIGAYRMVRRDSNITPLSKWMQVYTANTTINTGNGTGSTSNGNTDSAHSTSLSTADAGCLVYFQGAGNRSDPTISGATKNFGIDIRSNEWFAGASVYRTAQSSAYSVTSTILASLTEGWIAVAASFN